jgi:sulfur relay (sulfurtransferase) DsrC/TusE family protein
MTQTERTKFGFAKKTPAKDAIKLAGKPREHYF